MSNEFIVVVMVVILGVILGNRKNTKIVRKKKVVCIGDSGTYHTNAVLCPVENQWVSLLAANGTYQVVNSGISGNTSTQMLARFEADVIAHAPDYCVIECGGNDPMNWDTGTFDRELQMITLCRNNNIIPLILCCSPQFGSAQWCNNWSGISPDSAWLAAHPGHTDYNHVWEDSTYLPATRAAEQAYCAANGIKYIDVYTPMMLNGTNNPAYYAPWRDAAHTVTDGVHLNAAGNELIYSKVIAAINELEG